MDVEDLRLAVHDRFRHGRRPRVVDLAGEVDASVDDVRTGLRHLAAPRHVALGADREVVMAHPFTAVPLGFSANTDRTAVGEPL